MLQGFLDSYSVQRVPSGQGFTTNVTDQEHEEEDKLGFKLHISKTTKNANS